jgi:hypothetical protein
MKLIRFPELSSYEREQVLSVLYFMKDFLLTGKEKWTKGSLARDEFGNEVHWGSESARCWCIVGAGLRASITSFVKWTRCLEAALPRP